MNPIKYYSVRVPGSTCWLDYIENEDEAHEEARKANRVRPGHKVYAQHEDGTVTGPYTQEARNE